MRKNREDQVTVRANYLEVNEFIIAVFSFFLTCSLFS